MGVVPIFLPIDNFFSTFKNGIPEYHVEEAIKVVIMYINDRHKPAFYPED
jgi:hypothetical protein